MTKSDAGVKEKIDGFLLQTPTSAEFKSVKNTIIDVVESQHNMASRISSLEEKVSSIGDKLDALFSLLSNTDAKKGEKIVATKCTPDSIQTKDKDIDDDGDKNDNNPVTNVQIASIAQQPQHSKKIDPSGQRKSTGAYKAKHKTTADAPEDDDIIISNLADAKGLFFPYRYKETDEEIVLYYKDKKFEQKNARSAIGEGYVPVQGHEGHEKDEEVQKPKELIIQRKKRPATDIDQANTANQSLTPDADTNPEVKADPDALNLITDFDSDEKVIEALNDSALTPVVTPHNSEVDEKEKVDRRKADQACKEYLQRVLKSKRELWHKTKGKISDLSTIGLRDSISEQEDVDKFVKKLSWVEYNEKLKLIKSRTRSGIGHSNMEILRYDLLDINTLTENLGERISPSHLEKVEAVKIVHRKINDNNAREEILYFFKDGKVKNFTIQQLLMKNVTELKYIHYLLRVENSVTRNWSSMILEVIRRRVMTKDDKYNGDYVPEYRTYTGQEIKMKKGAAVLQVFLNSPQLSFSPDHEDVSLSFMLIGNLEISKSSISKLRSAIYHLGEDTKEKRELKKKLVKVLRDKEEERLKKFLETTVSYLKILNNGGIDSVELMVKQSKDPMNEKITSMIVNWIGLNGVTKTEMSDPTVEISYFQSLCALLLIGVCFGGGWGVGVVVVDGGGGVSVGSGGGGVSPILVVPHIEHSCILGFIGGGVSVGSGGGGVSPILVVPSIRRSPVQALGGHMRHHRTEMEANSSSTSTTISDDHKAMEGVPILKKSNSCKRFWGLDLNLMSYDNYLKLGSDYVKLTGIGIFSDFRRVFFEIGVREFNRIR
ncbi:hypothetical protein AgCh_033160 [Apium graveolens]